MTKVLWIYCPSRLFSKPSTFLYFYILSHLFSFWKPFPPPPPFSQTLINIRAVPSNDIFCSNAVLITIHSSSIQFFSLFDVLPSAHTTTAMTLMLLRFHILFVVFSIIFLLLLL